jgi:pyridoxal phosphate enzyme (YggS family)
MSYIPESGAMDRLRDTRARIEAAANEAGRNAEDVHLIAVSKTFEADTIRPVLDAGQRMFGENRVQEAARKWPALRREYPDVELHLIGPLQTNKVRAAVEIFDCIQTLDRPKLARALAAEIAKTGHNPTLFVQINTGAEVQKAGVAPGRADVFIAECRVEHELVISGLMCIPPVLEEPSEHFAQLAKIARRNGLAFLSMGMSADFETAVQFGATHVRVGQAIFGPRG